MKYILSIESATSNCSVALHSNEKVICSMELNVERMQSKKMLSMIDSILKSSEITFNELAAIAVSEGPGSYTGLRIGASIVKGICEASGLPLITLPTLQIIAAHLNYHQQIKNNTLICPMIDARRMEVYTVLYDELLTPQCETEPHILDESSFSNILSDHTVFFCGDGAEKASKVIRNKNAYFHPEYQPHANAMGKLAFQKFENRDFSSVTDWEPFYLKEFQAIKSKSLI